MIKEWIWWWVVIFVVIAMSSNGENSGSSDYVVGVVMVYNESDGIKWHENIIF